MPLDAAPMAYVLAMRFVRRNPADPGFIDRDRFVLSAGHASALLYPDDAPHGLRGDDARPAQALSPVAQPDPGLHPEYHLTSWRRGLDRAARTGASNAVGMAIGEAHLAVSATTWPGHEVFNHYTYALAGDGDLMGGRAGRSGISWPVTSSSAS